MNITLSGTKVSMDGHTLAFQKNNLVDSMVITVDTDETWQYKLDVKYLCKDSKGEELYNVIDLTRVGNTCTAILQATMLPFNGKYTMQLRGVSGDKVYHTDTFDVWVKYSIDPGKVYDPVPSEFYQIEQAVTEQAANAKQSATESAESATNAAASATKAENAAVHSPIVGENGNWLIWDFEKSEYVDSGKPASIGGGTDLSLGITGAQVGQIVKITAVDDSGKPTAWEAADLPNNEEFIVTFSGNDGSYVCDKTMNEIVDAYENGQDISARFTGSSESGVQYTNLILYLTSYSPYEYIEFKSDIEIYKLNRIVAFIDGSGYCGVSEETALDNSLTDDSKAANAKAVGDALATKQDTLIQSGATVGQIAKITTVDETGKPTAWEPVDFPSGEVKEWEEFMHITVDNNETTVFDFSSNGAETLENKKAKEVYIYSPNCSSLLAGTPDASGTVTVNGRVYASGLYSFARESLGSLKLWLCAKVDSLDLRYFGRDTDADLGEVNVICSSVIESNGLLSATVNAKKAYRRINTYKNGISMPSGPVDYIKTVTVSISAPSAAGVEFIVYVR